MFDTLNTIDDMELSYLCDEYDIRYRAERTQSKSSNIFDLVSSIHVDDDREEFSFTRRK